jgi:copper chaperone CopZ
VKLAWAAVLAALAIVSSAGAAEKSIVIRVAGWHSKGDAWRTESSLRSVKGVRQVATDAGKQQVTVVFDDAVASQTQIEKVIVDAGYTVAR